MNYIRLRYFATQRNRFSHYQDNLERNEKIAILTFKGIRASRIGSSVQFVGIGKFTECKRKKKRMQNKKKRERKKVLLHERKRHTARRLVSIPGRRYPLSRCEQTDNITFPILRMRANKKIALCGLRWFKVNVSKYQKDVKLSKRCQVVKKMSNVK